MGVNIKESGHQPKTVGINYPTGLRCIQLLPAGHNSAISDGNIFNNRLFAPIKNFGIFD
jgi:hypothetical protein